MTRASGPRQVLAALTRLASGPWESHLWRASLQGLERRHDGTEAGVELWGAPAQSQEAAASSAWRRAAAWTEAGTPSRAEPTPVGPERAARPRRGEQPTRGLFDEK